MKLRALPLLQVTPTQQAHHTILCLSRYVKFFFGRCPVQLDPTATPIHEVEDIATLTADTSTTGTQWGTGGMVTKLTAARIATGKIWLRVPWKGGGE